MKAEVKVTNEEDKDSNLQTYTNFVDDQINTEPGNIDNEHDTKCKKGERLFNRVTQAFNSVTSRKKDAQSEMKMNNFYQTTKQSEGLTLRSNRTGLQEYESRLSRDDGLEMR